MKPLNDFYTESAVRLAKSEERFDYRWPTKLTNESKVIRIFHPWLSRYDLETMKSAIVKHMTPLYLTLDGNPLHREGWNGNQMEVYQVEMGRVCGHVLEIVIDKNGMAADCLLTGPMAECAEKLLRSEAMAVAPRLVKVNGHMPVNGYSVVGFIAIDLISRHPDYKGHVTPLWKMVADKNEAFTEVSVSVNEQVKVHFNYNWPEPIDMARMVALVGGINNSTRKIRLALPNPTRTDAFAPLAEDEIAGTLIDASFTEKGIVGSFVLGGPRGNEVEKLLRDSPTALSFTPTVSCVQNEDMAFPAPVNLGVFYANQLVGGELKLDTWRKVKK